MEQNAINSYNFLYTMRKQLKINTLSQLFKINNKFSVKTQEKNTYIIAFLYKMFLLYLHSK